MEYRNVECEVCHKYFPFIRLLRHSLISDKINYFPRICSLTIEKGNIEEHIKNNCNHTLIEINFKIYMVVLINISKKIMQKMKEDNEKNLKILCNIIDDLKGQIEDIKNHSIEKDTEILVINIIILMIKIKI